MKPLKLRIRVGGPGKPYHVDIITTCWTVGSKYDGIVIYFMHRGFSFVCDNGVESYYIEMTMAEFEAALLGPDPIIDLTKD